MPPAKIARMSVIPVKIVHATVSLPRAEHRWESIDRRLPTTRRLVLYETLTAIRLGNVDETQQWRRLNGQAESEKVTSWIPAKQPTAAGLNPIQRN